MAKREGWEKTGLEMKAQSSYPHHRIQLLLLPAAACLLLLNSARKPIVIPSSLPHISQTPAHTYTYTELFSDARAHMLFALCVAAPVVNFFCRQEEGASSASASPTPLTRCPHAFNLCSLPPLPDTETRKPESQMKKNGYREKGHRRCMGEFGSTS